MWHQAVTLATIVALCLLLIWLAKQKGQL